MNRQELRLLATALVRIGDIVSLGGATSPSSYTSGGGFTDGDSDEGIGGLFGIETEDGQPILTEGGDVIQAENQ